MHRRTPTALLAGMLVCGATTSARAQRLAVTLLGTDSPALMPERSGPSILVQAGPEKLLFDLGRGAALRLWESGVPLRALSAVFFTHLHSDHVSGFPDLWLTGMLPNRSFAHRTEAMQVYGPAGTRAMMAHLAQAYEADIRIRQADEHIPPAAAVIVATDVGQGVVYERHGVRVTAFDVDHGDLIRPALGYRIDYAAHSVVLSGDTRVNDNLIRFAAGTDVLFHEVALAPPELLARSDAARRVIAHHTTPQAAATVFGRVNPRLAVYTHIVLLATEPDIPAPTVAELVNATRAGYPGRFEVGEDLMTVEVGDSIVVRRQMTAKAPAQAAEHAAEQAAAPAIQTSVPSAIPSAAQATATPATQVVLLGTGTPLPDPARAGPSTALVVNRTAYIVDFGVGVVRRAAAARDRGVAALEPMKLRIGFITHLHSDHTLGLADVILTPWIMGRTEPLELYGPPGLLAMVDHLLQAYAVDIRTRTEDLEHANRTGFRVHVHEVTPGVVYRDSNVVVTAFDARHGDVLRSYGYRLQTTNRSIVIAGDASARAALAEQCRGCDVLIDGTYTQASFALVSPAWQRYRESYHTSTTDLAAIATRAHPGLLILTHRGNAGCDQANTAECRRAGSEAQMLREVREGYRGRVVAGHDLDIY
ncbi:MAG TPA: MBL fold metallo-hydrolase [Gemmatimonadaceae bacterium]|nr:MBL fold metallo-hydrolase [Gemmatimonadaceae bacterium]